MQIVDAATAVVLFLDLQDDVISGFKTIGRHKLRKTAAALAELAALHGLPAFLSAIPLGGRSLKSVLEPLVDAVVRHRTFTSAFGDAALVAGIAASGRKVLVLAGVASEIVVLRTALDAPAAGYDMQRAIDACGGLSDRTEAAAWSRATAAGATVTSVVTKTLELLYEAAGKWGIRDA